MHFNSFYSKEAIGLYQWAQRENNHIKAVRIQRAAMSVEVRYRKTHNLAGRNPVALPPLKNK